MDSIRPVRGSRVSETAFSIDGVVTKDLATHTDERGFFREIVRVTDPFFGEGFGQLSQSLLHTGVAKAWHVHQRQVDWWYVPTGRIKLVLHDLRQDSATRHVTVTVLLGDHEHPRVVRIPPGVAHGCRCLQGPAVLLYITSRT